MCGNELKIKFPSECSTDEKRKFKELVKIGGQVKLTEKNFECAHKVCFIENTGDFMAVGAIKKPQKSYKDTIFCKACAKNDSANYEYELGWIVVSKKCQGKGLAKKIIQTLMKELGNENCYATTQISNKAMDYLLTNNKFEKLGSPYLNEDETYYLQIYHYRNGTKRD